MFKFLKIFLSEYCLWLNKIFLIKALSLKLNNPGPKKLILDAQVPWDIKAKNLNESADIEILNPEQTICNLDDNTKIYMELTVNTGKGYVPADKNLEQDSPLGLIPVDSVYSPVKRVSYNISETREGLSSSLVTLWEDLFAYLGIERY